MTDTSPHGFQMPDPVSNRRGSASRTGYLLDAVRYRPLGRRLLSSVAGVLFLLGLGMFTYPLLTDVYADVAQQAPLEDVFADSDYRVAYETRQIRTGDPLTRIVLPDIDIAAIVVEGTSPAALRAGAGHYPNTPLPGERGNVAIAGHRTTYGKPFNRLDELEVGQQIRLETPLAVHIYEIVPPPPSATQPCRTSAAPNRACWITNPQDWGVVGPSDEAILTLTTCHPKGSARQRLILRAQLVETVPHDSIDA